MLFILHNGNFVKFSANVFIKLEKIVFSSVPINEHFPAFSIGHKLWIASK